MVNPFQKILKNAIKWAPNSMFNQGGTLSPSYGHRIRRSTYTNWHPTRLRKNAPGRKRKLGANAYMAPPRPNLLKQRFKSLIAGIYLTAPRWSIPAPTQDQVRTLERRFGEKLIVKQGQLHYRDTGLPIVLKTQLQPTTKSP